MSIFKKIMSYFGFKKEDKIETLKFKANTSYEYDENIKLCLVDEDNQGKMLYVKNGLNIVAIALDAVDFEDFAQNSELDPEILEIMTTEDLQDLLSEYEEMDLFEKCAVIQKVIDSRN